MFFCLITASRRIIIYTSAGTVAFSKQFYKYTCTVSGGERQAIASSGRVRYRTPIKQVSQLTKEILRGKAAI